MTTAILAVALIASSWFGARSEPSLDCSATCRSSGSQSVWIAQTGTAFLDIIQVGTMDGRLFYAYGRGVPNGVGSLYVEQLLGPAGTGPHTYRLRLAAGTWRLSVDGRVVARVSDSFRTWRLRATQIMAEGDLPMGTAYCRLGLGDWHFGGYGPQPPQSFGDDWWKVNP